MKEESEGRVRKEEERKGNMKGNRKEGWML